MLEDKGRQRQGKQISIVAASTIAIAHRPLLLSLTCIINKILKVELIDR